VLPHRKDCTVQAQLGLVMAQRGHKMRPMPRCSGYEENKRQPVGSTTARHQSMERVHCLVYCLDASGYCQGLTVNHEDRVWNNNCLYNLR